MNTCTMEMPADIKAKWLTALRSGEYVQGDGCLYDDHMDTYCCLGVLMRVVDGDNADYCGNSVALEGAVPHRDWYADKGLHSFLGPTKYTTAVVGREQHSILMFMNDGFELDEKGYSRQVEKKSFLEIADYIEANIKGV